MAHDLMATFSHNAPTPPTYLGPQSQLLQKERTRSCNLACLHLYDVSHAYAGSLLDRLSKGDRIPVTAQLMPLVDTPADVWNQPPEPDLEDKQVSAESPFR